MSFNSIPPNFSATHQYNDPYEESAAARSISGRATPTPYHPENKSCFISFLDGSGSDSGSDSDSDDDSYYARPDFTLNSTFQTEDAEEHQHVNIRDISPKSETEHKLNDASSSNATRPILDLDKDIAYAATKAKLDNAFKQPFAKNRNNVGLYYIKPDLETIFE